MKTTPRLSSRHRLLGFTLVELLVCALIISVVATVAAVSYSGYASTSRDSARTQDIKTIYDLMTVYRTQNLKNVTP
jgi:prepilin-type N-terminal cleavage/methylation domain-containing protein